jgi:hypothetical protein
MYLFMETDPGSTVLFWKAEECDIVHNKFYLLL